MNQSVAPEIPVQVYERSLSEIQSIFPAMTLNELTGLSLDYMPQEVREIISKHLEAWNVEQAKLNPVKEVKYTESLDGKTCKFCGAVLVESKDHTFVYCPTEPRSKCFSFKNVTGIDLTENNKKLETFDTYTKEYFQHYESDKEFPKKVMLRNAGERIIGSSYTFSSDEVNPINLRRNTIAVKFELKDVETLPYDKKAGKIISVTTCEHKLEQVIKSIKDSKHYKLVQVASIGHLLTKCECFPSDHVKEDFEQYKKTQMFRQDEVCNQYSEGYFVTETEYNEIIDSCITYELRVQRIIKAWDDETENVMRNKRMVELNNHHYPSASITGFVLGQVKPQLEFDEKTMKAQVNACCRKLVKEGIFEQKTEQHIFNEERQDPALYKRNGKYLCNNRSYVGGAKTLNEYRFVNKHSVYLTEDQSKVWSEYIEAKRTRSRTEAIVESKNKMVREVLAKYNVESVRIAADGEIYFISDVKRKGISK